MRTYEWSCAMKSIRSQVDRYDEDLEGRDGDNIGKDLNASKTSIVKQGNITLGSMQKRCLLKDIAAAHSKDSAFSLFERKFRHFIEQKHSSEFSDGERQEISSPNSSVCFINQNSVL
jgi:hypothetical protein